MALRQNVDLTGFYYDVLTAMDGWEKGCQPWRYANLAAAKRDAAAYYHAVIEEYASAVGYSAATLRPHGPGLSATFDVLRDKFKREG